MLDAVHPRPGIRIADVRHHLREYVNSIYNATTPQDYALWVDGVETTLREGFVGVPFDRLYSERYWRLTTGPHARPHELLRAEQRDQREWLDEIVGVMTAMEERFASPAAPLAVVDTNVLMHAKPLPEIDWQGLLAAAVVRIVIPMRVVEELDERKYGRRDDLRKRARNRVQSLARYIEDRAIKDGVHVEVVSWRLLDTSGVPRARVDPDEDILDTCEALRVYADSNAVLMVTGDTAMHLRARERELTALKLGEEDMQTTPDEEFRPVSPAG